MQGCYKFLFSGCECCFRWVHRYAQRVILYVCTVVIFVPPKRGLVFWLIQALVGLNVSFYLANVLSVDNFERSDEK